MHQVRYAQDEILLGEVNPFAQQIEVSVRTPVVQDLSQQREVPLDAMLRFE